MKQIVNSLVTQNNADSFLTDGPMRHGRKLLCDRAGLMSTTLLIGLALGAIGFCVWYFFPISKKDAHSELITYEVRKDNLVVSVLEQGTLESSDNTEIKCQVRGKNTITTVIDSGTFVKKGDELLRLDTLALEEAITERRKFALLTKASALRLQASVRSARLAIEEYKKGTFINELAQIEKNLVIAKSNLKSAENLLFFHEDKLARRGFTSETKIAELKISVQQYENQVKKQTEELNELRKFTKKKELATLEGERAATRANYDAEAERAIADLYRKVQAEDELKHCVVTAPRDGLVIHPSAAQWEGAPDIEEGATVYKTQIMLLMPDLEKMQVKVGIHESVVGRVKKGMKAIVTLNDREIEGNVFSVANITRPAGWWTGNVVKYDTIIKLAEGEKGLKPGMSAEVKIILASYENVVTVPVAAVLQSPSGDFCWVKSDGQVKRRLIELGDSNDVFIHVKSGLAEGDEVVLNPLSYIDEAEREALLPKNEDEEEGKAEPSESLAKSDP